MPALCLIASVAGCGGPPGVPAVPNVLIIVMDTTRADRCSIDGYGRETTPALASLAREGANFRDAWSPAGWTGPAHASLFTGLRPEHHGFRRSVREYLLDGTVTLAARLRDAGYRTACFSNNNTVSPEFGLCEGFDEVFPLYEDEERPYPYARATHVAALEWAMDCRRDGVPFFVFVNDMEPHHPYTPPEDLAAKFVRPGRSPDSVAAARRLVFGNLFAHNVRAKPLAPEVIAAASDLYDAEIACLDAEIGHFAEDLRREGILDDTIFVVTADHGENFGDHGLMDHMFSLHRSIRQVPLLIRYPGAFAPNTVVDDVVRLEDVAPTVLDILSLPALPRADGASLRSRLPGRLAIGLLDSPDAMLNRLEREFPMPFSASFLRGGTRSVADGRHDYIRSSRGEEELFDLRNDPEEKWNVAVRGGPVLERMRALLDEATSAESPPSPR